MSKTAIYIHLVFATKYRRGTILPEGRDRLYAYLSGVIENNMSHVCAIGGYKDHIHILLDLHPSVALASLVREMKTSSVALLKRERFLNYFEGWADGYYAGSISPGHKKQCEDYINNQENHHSGISLEEEMEKMASKYDLSYHINDWL